MLAKSTEDLAHSVKKEKKEKDLESQDLYDGKRSGSGILGFKSPFKKGKLILLLFNNTRNVFGKLYSILLLSGYVKVKQKNSHTKQNLFISKVFLIKVSKEKPEKNWSCLARVPLIQSVLYKQRFKMLSYFIF